jgi:hypothetical protein
MAIVAELPYDGIADVAYPDISRPRGWQQAALCIAEKLTQAHSGEQLTKALDLVLTNAVILNPDDTATVRDGNRAYKINGQCTCEDARRQTIWCVHRLAVEIHQRAIALLSGARHANAQKPPNDASKPLSGNDQNDQPPAPLPVESFPPSTCCIKDTVGTREICWTLRGEDEAVSHRVQRVLTFLDKLKAAVPSPQETSG